MEPYQSFPCVEVPLFARPSGLLGFPHIFRVSQQILSRKAKIIVKPKQCRYPFNLTDFLGEMRETSFWKVFRKEEIKDLNFISFFFSSSSRFAHPIRRRRRWLKTRLAPSMLLVSELKILSIVQMLRVPLLYTAIMEKRRNDDTLYVIFNLHVRNFALKCIPFITIHASWGVMEGGSLPSPQTKPCTVLEIHSKSLILQDLNEMRFFGWIFNHMHKLFRGAGVYLFRIPSTLRSPFQNWGRL